MDDLDKLYADSTLSCGNPICDGCSILGKNKTLNAYMDYEQKGQCDVLFLSDSLKHKYGKVQAFWKNEIDLINEVCDVKYETAASVKCSSVKEADMKTADQHKCRNHLEETIATIRPRLVFACGNLAMKMLTKKSGITGKRGSVIDYVSDEHECKVVPIFHPYQVIKEPKNLPLFQTDIRNGINLFIKEKYQKKEIEYKLLTEVADVVELADWLSAYTGDIAVDTETTGLDFNRDKIMTVSLTTDEGTWVIPYKHKDSPFIGEDLEAVRLCLKKILEHLDSNKVMHNAKFDLKFFYGEDIFPKNVWDTKLMYHNLDENSPKGLMDLVKRFFPEELAQL